MTKALFRALLLGTGAVGAYLALSTFDGAASAHEDQTPLGGVVDEVVGGGLGGLLPEVPLAGPETDPAQAPPANAAPAAPADPAPAAPAGGATGSTPAEAEQPAAGDGAESTADSPPDADTGSGPESRPEEEQPPGAGDRPAPDRNDHATDSGPLGLLDPVERLVVTDPLGPLVTGVVDALDTTAGPLLPTVDSLVPPLGPVLEDVVESTTGPILPGVVGPVVEDVVESTTGPILPGVVGPVVEDVIGPTGPVLPPPLPDTEAPEPRSGPQAPGGPGPPGTLVTALGTAWQPASAEPPASIGSAGARPEPRPTAPRPATPPHPLSTHQLSGKTFDPGHPWPSTAPSNPPAVPGHDPRCSVQDVLPAALVMPIYAPPG